VLDHTTSEIATGSKLGIDATKKIPGEGFKHPGRRLIRMSGEVRRKIDGLFGSKLPD
jgi:4-hydroxy-3-polyprenylbenzoate decarboxylase